MKTFEDEALKLALEALEFDGFTPHDATHRHYTITAITAIKTALTQPVQEPTAIAKMVEGMEVSIDVSTGDHDSGHRLFGTVTLAQENQGSKHGLILLVQDPKPNFKTTTPPQREWVELTPEDIFNALRPDYEEFECVEFLNCAREDYQLISDKLKEKNNGA